MYMAAWQAPDAFARLGRCPVITELGRHLVVDAEKELRAHAFAVLGRRGAQMMHFDPSAPMEAAGATLVRLAAIIDRSTLGRRADALTTQITKNPVLVHFLTREHAVELTIDRLFRRRGTTGRWPKKVQDGATAEALSFAFFLTEVHRRLPPKAQTELQRRLFGSLKGSNSLAPIVHEMTVACHLMNRGWDVAFHDLEEGEGYDYLARNGTDEIEVECKRASADTGRKVHRNDFGKLAGPLLPALESFAIRRDGESVHLRVADRLPTGDQDLSRLRGAVPGTMETATGVAANDFTVDVTRAGLSHPLTVGEDTVRQEVERYLGTEHFHSVYAVNRPALAVFAFTSQKRDPSARLYFQAAQICSGPVFGAATRRHLDVHRRNRAPGMERPCR
jgi:hypothetical protein